MSFPNFFKNRAPWFNISFGGRPVKAALVKVNGVETSDEWKKQKSKETSGSVNVFAGTTVGEPELTFEACDEADFDDLRQLWEQLAPVPGLAPAATSGTAVAPTTGAVGSPPAPAITGTQGAVGGATTTASTIADPSAAAAPAAGSAAASAGAKDPDPGPRPPTVPVSYLPLAWHGITSVARKKWVGPTFTDTGSIQHTITFIPDTPPKPAGAGAMAPAAPGAADPGAQFTQGGGAGGAAPAPAGGTMEQGAASGAAGT